MQDFDEIIINRVRAAEPDLDERLKSQAEALSALQCSDSVLGRWIDTYDVDYLIAAFNLNDADFAKNFPDMSHLNHHDRGQIIQAFEDHIDRCAHCHLKRGFDMEMNARIEKAYLDHGEPVPQHAKTIAPLQQGTNEVDVTELPVAAEAELQSNSLKAHIVVCDASVSHVRFWGSQRFPRK